MIVIRPAATEELTAAESVAESSFAELRRVYVPKTVASDDSGFSRVVAVNDGQIVGTVLYAIQSGKLHLRDLAVDAQYRRQGTS
jgi:predicted N-acetyltransferase YhbS